MFWYIYVRDYVWYVLISICMTRNLIGITITYLLGSGGGRGYYNASKGSFGGGALIVNCKHLILNGIIRLEICNDQKLLFACSWFFSYGSILNFKLCVRIIIYLRQCEW
jgi:hypothetical protein